MRVGYVGLALACAGCVATRGAVDPNAYAPKKPETIWRGPKLDEPIVFDEKEPVSLAQAIDIALRNNPNTKLSWAKARFAAAQYGFSQSPDFPNVSVAYTYQRSRTLAGTAVGSEATSANVETIGTPSPATGNQSVFFSQWGPQLLLSYTLLDFGQTRASIEVAKQALIQANYTHNRELQNVIQTVMKDFYDLLYQKELLVSYEADYETARVTYTAAQMALDLGVKDISDVLQSQTKLLQSQIQVVSQTQNVINSQATLLTALGLGANTPLIIEGLPDVPPFDEISSSADALLAVAMKKRADLIAADADLKSQEANVSLATRQFFPTVDYNLSIGQTSFTGIGSDGYDFVSTFSLNIPIFSGFSNLNSLKKALAGRDQASARKHQKELLIIEEITMAHSGVKSAFKNMEISDELLTASQKEYDVALEKYKAGVATILDVVTAQSSLADARAKQAQFTNGWLSALVQLSYAVGSLEPLKNQDVQ